MPEAIYAYVLPRDTADPLFRELDDIVGDLEAIRLPEVTAILHPEGGYYGELYRSNTVVHPADGRGPRSALTTIYFILTGETVSRWHRVQSDEVWHF